MAPYSLSTRSSSTKTRRKSKNRPPYPAASPPQPEGTYHLRSTQNIPNPIPDPCPCPKCGQYFQGPKALAGHQNRHRGDRNVSIPESNGAVASQPPIQIRGRQTYESRLNHVMNPNPGDGSVGPSEPRDRDKYSLWQHNAPCCRDDYRYEIDYNTSRYFKNSYLRKHNIRPSGSSISAESSNGWNRNMDDDLSSMPIVMIDLTALHDG